MAVGVASETMEAKCGCKGIRTCLVCEHKNAIVPQVDKPQMALYQCHKCGRILEARAPCGRLDPDAPPLYSCQSSCSSVRVLRASHRQDGEEWQFEGVTMVKDFISAEEEDLIAGEIDSRVWVESQSGRRKQDYGPKVNFKRQKVKLDSFNGLPPFSRTLVERMRREVGDLRDFTPVELCNLDYCPERGSSIDPHTDDSWLWGERLVTLNLLSHTTLTFSAPSHPPTSHIHIPLPRRCLAIVRGSARYHWQHSIQRRHIVARRLGVTLRELSPEFLPHGEQAEVGRKVLEIAMCFDGHPTNFRPSET